MITIGPADARLTVHTTRQGVAAKIGHDLEIEVADWSATYDDDGFALTADAGSLQVVAGHGGAKPLTDGDKRKIRKNIDKDVLGGGTIRFSTVGAGEGDLELNGRTGRVGFELTVTDGAIRGEAAFRQSDFGIEPYTGFFGALKVADEVRVAIDGRLP